ncbi:MAG: hypothetical protein AB7S26_42240 [Sandaracinaceae bacterium]
MTSRLALALLLVACDGGTSPGSDAGPMPLDAGALEVATEPTLPSVTGTCPDMTASGTVTFAPAGIAPREVQLWVSDAAATLDGPLVFWWHGTGGAPTQAENGLGMDTIDAILALGGIVAAPVHDPDAGRFPWFLTTGSRDDDLLLADEILACAIAGPGVDVMRVHSLGSSAGALHTAQMNFRRASYLASVVTYSGGLVTATAPRTDAPTSRPAALILHGGPDDVVVIQFQQASEMYWEISRQRGRFAAICAHDDGHGLVAAARDSAWQFLTDHPFGAVPSPYEGGLPAGFYAPCALEP